MRIERVKASTPALLLITAATLSACSGSDDVPVAPSTTGTTLATTTQPPSSASVAPLPAGATVDLQDAHANGTTVRVTSVSFREDRIELRVSATNGGERASRLAESAMVLVDDHNVQHRFNPPLANPVLELPPGTTQEHTIVFRGRISPSATSLTLITNSGAVGGEAETTTTPTMRVGPIPVGASAA